MNLIDVYAERLRAAGNSEATVGSRCRALRRIDRDLPQGLVAASGDELAAILAGCATAWTRYTYYSHLKGYYSTMVTAGKLTYDPTTAIPRPRQGDSLPDPVADHELFIALERSPDSPWRCAVLLAAYQGLRCAEIAHLERADVTEARVHVRVGKGGRSRFIPTHPSVWDYVHRLPAGPVVCDAYGEAVTPQWLTHAQARHWQRIGLARMHLHRFRHWFGTTLVDQGNGIEVVCELMGHASIATTQGYVRVAQSRRAAAIRTLPVMAAAELVTSKLGHPATVAA